MKRSGSLVDIKKKVKSSAEDDSIMIAFPELGDVSLLLCGKTPKIYSARDRPKTVREPKGVYDEFERNPRFAPIRRFQEFKSHKKIILDPEIAAKRIKEKEKLRLRQMVTDLNEEKKYGDNLINKIDIYEQCHLTKSFMKERECEELYIRPLNLRIKEQLEDGNIEKHRERYREFVKRLDSNPTPILSDKDPGDVEHIIVDVSDLRDPMIKYRYRMETEDKLISFIKNGKESVREVPKLPPLNTLDYKMCKMRQCCRFFDGPGNPYHSMKFGRKYYGDIRNSSRVPEALNSFAVYEK